MTTVVIAKKKRPFLTGASVSFVRVQDSVFLVANQYQDCLVRHITRTPVQAHSD